MSNNYTLRISADLQSSDLAGKRYVVTGGTSGAGQATVQFLAEHGAEVITCGRDIARGEAAFSGLSEEARNRITIWKMDLLDLSSIKEFADKVQEKWDKFDGLVNNAGVMLPTPNHIMTKGKKYDIQFMTNHVGHFYLTKLLLPLLIANSGGRVVNVSSVAHDRCSLGGKEFDGRIHFDDVHCRERPYDDGQYHQSKLANVLHAKQLASRYAQDGIYAFSAHPGTVESNLIRDYGFFTKNIIFPLAFKFAKDTFRPIPPMDGAQTSLHCLLSPEALQHNGAYFAQTGFKHRNGERGGWPFVSPNPEAQSDEIAEKLWVYTEELLEEVLS